MKSDLIVLNLLFLVSAFTSCQEKSHHQDKSDLMIGIKVYNIDRELNALFEEWDDLGINAVFASPSVFNDQFTALAKKHDIHR
jgi:hypothetical protein